MKIRKITSFMLAVLMVFGMIAVNTGEAAAASAKERVYVQSSHNFDYSENRIYVGEWGNVVVNWHSKEGVVSEYAVAKSVKVSNKSVAKVRKQIMKGSGGEKCTYFYVVGKKPGKTKVTVKYKLNGKPGTKTATVRVLKNPKPIKSLTINGKKIKVSGKNAYGYIAKINKANAKIKIVPAKGWRIASAECDVYDKNGNNHKHMKVTNKVKNGKAIKFGKKANNMFVDVLLVNDKANNGKGAGMFYTIDLSR